MTTREIIKKWENGQEPYATLPKTERCKGCHKMVPSSELWYGLCNGCNERTCERFIAWRDGGYLGNKETVRAARRFYGFDQREGK